MNIYRLVLHLLHPSFGGRAYRELYGEHHSRLTRNGKVHDAVAVGEILLRRLRGQTLYAVALHEFAAAEQHTLVLYPARNAEVVLRGAALYAEYHIALAAPHFV